MGLPKETEDCTSASPEKEHTSKDPSPDSWPPPPQFPGKLPGESAPESAFPEEVCLNSQEGRLHHEVQQIQQGKVPQKGEQEVQLGQAPQQRDPKKEKHHDKDKADKGKSSKSSKK